MSLSSVDKAPALDRFSDRALREASEAIAASHGWLVDFVVSDDKETFSTTYDLSTGRIRVIISRALLDTAETSGVLSPAEILSIAIAHELGHVRDYQDQPPDKHNRPDHKTEYFNNIVDDIAINFGLMNKTTYMQRLFRQTYDTVLTPRDSRASLSNQPNHVQLMYSLLALAMLDPSASRNDTYSDNQLAASMATLEIPAAPEVLQALEAITSHDHQGQTINILRVLRTHGLDLSQRSLASAIIRQQFDALYEEDSSKQQSGTDQSDQNQADQPQDFDYSDQGGCKHERQDKNDPSIADQTTQQTTTETTDTDQAEDSAQQETSPTETPESLAKAIAESIEKAGQAGRKEAERIEKEATAQAEHEEMLRIQSELGLDDDDFTGYMAARTRHWSDIVALADIISQLKRERSDALLSPSREIRAKGHRINVTRLAHVAARDQLEGNPEIFKASHIGEKIQYEFDGLDLFLCGDVSDSMRFDNKASESAAVAVALLEGLRLAAQTANLDDLVRIQIQAFGNTNRTLAPLGSHPTPRILGTTYHKLKNPRERTYVAPTLEIIRDIVTQSSPSEVAPRLRVIAIISDGQFQDKTVATRVGGEVGEALGENGVILQLVLGGASVSKLHEQAQIINVSKASDLPHELLGRLPELLQAMRNKHA